MIATLVRYWRFAESNDHNRYIVRGEMFQSVPDEGFGGFFRRMDFTYQVDSNLIYADVP
jgi:hypothetical protein